METRFRSANPGQTYQTTPAFESAGRNERFIRALLFDAVMAETIHQRFVLRLPSLEQEMGEELFISGLVGPYRVSSGKMDTATGSMTPLPHGMRCRKRHR